MPTASHGSTAGDLRSAPSKKRLIWALLLDSSALEEPLCFASSSLLFLQFLSLPRDLHLNKNPPGYRGVK